MLLYHGTSLKNGEKILTAGIQPRRARRGNWTHCDLASRSDCVYLTDVYAGYYACNADPDGKGWAIFEIDADQLNRDHLLPDEDYLVQVARRCYSDEHLKEYGGPDPRAMTAFFSRHLKNYSRKLNRPRNEMQLLTNGQPTSWEISLQQMGTCAYYGPIPLQAITRVCFWHNPLESPYLIHHWLEPTICMENYMHGGREHYGALTRAMFDPQDETNIEDIAFSWLGGRQEWEQFERFQLATQTLSSHDLTTEEGQKFLQEALKSPDLDSKVKRKLQKRFDYAREMLNAAHFEISEVSGSRPPARSQSGGVSAQGETRLQLPSTLSQAA